MRVTATRSRRSRMSAAGKAGERGLRARYRWHGRPKTRTPARGRGSSANLASSCVRVATRPPSVIPVKSGGTVRISQFYCRALSCDALPLSVRHFEPRVSPAVTHIERLAFLVGALTYPQARCYGRIAEHGYLHIFILSTDNFARFGIRQGLSLVGDFPVVAGTDELVSQQRGDEIRVVGLLGFEPLIFE